MRLVRCGTDSSYALGCRCRPCRNAHAAYAAAWRRGEVGGTEDAAAYRRIVREFLRTGTLRRLCMATGLNMKTAHDIACGRTERIQRRTAEKIGALTQERNPE